MKRRPAARILYTVGHSTRTAGELIEILETYAVTRLVDIRSIPRSRTNPQFNLDVLPATLHAAGISYVHLASLGGRRSKIKGAEADANAGWERQPFHNYADYADTALFHEGLTELVAFAQGETCAIMCAEVLWWRCHRRIVADHVLARGIPVVHIATRERSEPAAMTPFAVVGKAGAIAYPAVATASSAITRPRRASPKRRAHARPERRSPA
ncbi:DUF488 domain-containing protein [soil metagenome]